MTEGRPAAAASAPLWERDAEIGTVARAIEELRADRSSAGGLLVFRGEAGLGKTALLAEIRRMAEGRGCTVWYARGAETLRSVPFNVVRQLLQPALLSLLPEEAREYLGDWYDIAGPALGIAEPQEESADPQYVCDGLVAAVRRLARREWPLVLLIDDAHWADQETLRWLAAFAERLDDLSVLVVVARRPGEVSGESARHLDAVAEAAGRPVNNLRALTPDAAAGLTRAALGRHADDAFCREVWAVTAGNPYDAVELLAKVQESEVSPVEARAGELRALNRAARGGGWSTGSGNSASRPPSSPGPPPSSAPASPSARPPASPPWTRRTPGTAPNCCAPPVSSPRPPPRPLNTAAPTWSSCTR